MTEQVLIRADELGDDFEDKVAANGMHELTIKSASLKTAQKSERQYLSFSVAVDDDPDAAPIFQSLFFEKEGDEARTIRGFKRDFVRFFTLFGIPLNKEITEETLPDLVGSTGKCLTKQVEIERDGVKSGDFQAVLVLPKIAGK